MLDANERPRLRLLLDRFALIEDDREGWRVYELQPGTYGAAADPAKPASGVAHYVPFVRRPTPGCR